MWVRPASAYRQAVVITFTNIGEINNGDIMEKIIRSIGVGFVLLFYSVISTAATLVVQNGALMGATNVDVNGVLYNVQFLSGSCIDLYSGCDENTDFPFTNPDNLNDGVLLATAMQALLDQVFLDTPLGSFDSSPGLTNGCGSEVIDCFVGTPLWVSAGGGTGVTSAYNTSNRDSVTAGGGSTSDAVLGIDPNSRSTYAVWSQTTVVPVPAAFWLFGSGLLGLIGCSRRSHK